MKNDQQEPEFKSLWGMNRAYPLNAHTHNM